MTSWEEVNKGLRQMGELKLKMLRAAARLKQKVDDAQAIYDTIKGPADEEYEGLEAKIRAFAEAHKTEFVGKKRTKKFSFGEVNFKLSSGKVELKFSDELVIRNLRKQGHGDCVRVIESVDKEAAKNLDEKELLKAGIEVTREDNCTVKPDLKKIQEEVTA